MEFLIVIAVALAASALTLFSGFGLGTLLLPAFALVFPLEVAIAATAVVHLANNLFKGTLLRNDANWRVVGRFGVPALLFAFLGAWLLLRIPDATVASWQLGEVTRLGLVVGSMIVAFALFDLIPRLRAWSVGERHLPIGGALSGFFGGLSGHQGALRSVFLTKTGMDARAFVATGVFCAILVDVGRLLVYGVGGLRPDDAWLVATACVAAFAGAYIGKRLLGKVTIDQVRTLVGALLLVMGGAIAGGVV
ncbi:MAG: sulfite exporter TauE/SafE family protein [Thermoplasmatota archaeon]